MPLYSEDEHYIKGAHGTLAEQKDEAYYDDRSDASDDMEKGRLKFPKRIYGRERELNILQNIYSEIVSPGNEKSGNLEEEEKIANVEGKGEGSLADQGLASSTDPYSGSRVVFLSGYSGMGKSALVNEFIQRIQQKHQSSEPLLHASGKYNEQSSSSAPFSAIAQVLERLALILSRDRELDDDKSQSNDYFSNIRDKIRQSDLIGHGTEGGRILRATFTGLSPLLDDKSQQIQSDDEPRFVHPTMNAIKECTYEILSVICGALNHALVIFLDDLQWGDEGSIELLSFLLTSTKLRNIMFICAYRSNEVDGSHSFTKLMENITKARTDSSKSDAAPLRSVESLDLFSLSPDATTEFIADSVKKEITEDVSELAEAIYTKTMGNIFFTKQALEELVRKNVLFYDVMCFEWRWVLSKVELESYMSDDVVETVKGKIRELPPNIQNLIVVMSFIPITLDVPILTALMNHGESCFEENVIRNLLKEACDEGMLMFSGDSKCYVFAHDRIRQASHEFAAEDDQDQLVLHISQVLQNFAAKGQEMEWCLYVAVDLLNSLPSDKTNKVDLIELNVKVARVAKGRGSMKKENELLHNGLKLLESSGVMWKKYRLSLELCNAVIISDYSLGSYDRAKLAIGNVLKNAKTLEDKLQAHLHQFLCRIEETSDYSQGAIDGVKILNLHGFCIPEKITASCVGKEYVRLKLALRNRSYACLTKLPVAKNDPILYLFCQVQKCALFSANDKLLKILAWKAIQYKIKQGEVGGYLAVIIGNLASLLAKQGEMKTALEISHVSIALCDKISDDIENCAIATFMAHTNVLSLFQPFTSSVGVLLQCHKDLRLIGGMTEAMLGCMMAYFETFFAAGLELSPMLESLLLLVEDLCRSQGRPGFLTNFRIYRQFALNLRTRSENPTEFLGEAFQEEEALSMMNSNSRKMALRDSSSLRLQLAFVYRNDDHIIQLLETLLDYPLKDAMVARLHNRLCFTGLAALSLGKRKNCASFSKLGQNCLSYFENLTTKHGSANAKPVYLFMLAIKSPSREAYMRAIDACADSSMIHLEAMAKERYALLLEKLNDVSLANDYLTSSYWLYQDWGAHAKALRLSQEYDYLKYAKRNTAESLTVSVSASATSSRRQSFKGNIAYAYNSTFQSKKKILVKEE